VNAPLVQESKTDVLPRSEVITEDFQSMQTLEMDMLRLPDSRKTAPPQALEHSIRTDDLTFFEHIPSG